MKPPKSIDPKDFAGPMVPKWLLQRPEISSGAKLVYAFLADRTSGPDFPEYEVAIGLDQKRIASGIGASERSVRNWLEELKKFDLVRYEVAGWGKPNLYFFLKHLWQG